MESVPGLFGQNVVERLPREQQEQTGSLIRAAWKLDAKDGMARLRKLRASAYSRKQKRCKND